MAKETGTTAGQKQVVKKQNTDVAVLGQLSDMVGEGFENADKDAYAIPFLRILQSNSPQVNEDEEAYIEGARPGMLFNTVSLKLYGKSINIVPIHYARSFIEWVPDRGGFVKDHGPDPRILDSVVEVDEKNNSILNSGNVIQDTRNHFVLLADALTDGPIILSMSSTGIRHSKKFMTQMSNLQLPNEGGRAPMFAGVWSLESVLNKNDQGSWYGFGDRNTTRIKFENWVNKIQLDSALATRDLVTSGDAQADWDSNLDNAKKVNEEGVPF